MRRENAAPSWQRSSPCSWRPAPRPATRHCRSACQDTMPRSLRDITRLPPAQPIAAADSTSQTATAQTTVMRPKATRPCPNRSPTCRSPSPSSAFPLAAVPAAPKRSPEHNAAGLQQPVADGAADRRSRRRRSPPPMPPMADADAGRCTGDEQSGLCDGWRSAASRRPRRRRRASWPRCSAPSPASATPAPLVNTGRANSRPCRPSRAAAAKPIITLASAELRGKAATAGLDRRRSRPHHGGDALPGVRQTALFEIKRKSGLDDDSDVDLNEDEGSAALPGRLGRRPCPAGAERAAEAERERRRRLPEAVAGARAEDDRGPLRQQDDRHVRLSRPGPQPPRQRRQELAAHVLRRRRHPGSRRLQVGTGELHPHHARPRRRRHLLPHRIPSTSTSAPSATGTGAAAVGNNTGPASR